MVNSIKLDDVNAYLDLHKPGVKAAAPAIEPTAVNVSMTNQMQHLVNLVKHEEGSSQTNNKLNDIRESIKNDTYQIDLDGLSEKMIADGIIL